jgi:hypothetical protein
MAMDAVLATIANGGQASIVINKEAVEINKFLPYFIDSTEFLRQRPRATPSLEAPGVGYARPIKPCRWRGKRLHHGGDVCVLVFS